MDAPAGNGQDVRPFIAIAKHLLRSARQRFLTATRQNGFLLIEDLGDETCLSK
jgi:aminoglycoside/choline kinase family phosphotransferase